jgi:hypothetical protein
MHTGALNKKQAASKSIFMAFQLISLTPDALLEAFQAAVAPLYYPSETDAPLEIFHFSPETVGPTFSAEDAKRLFYGAGAEFRPDNIQWLEANRWESNGAQRFFRDLDAFITTYPNNEYRVQELYHREQAPRWQALRHLFFDHLVQQRWLRVNLAEPDTARADMYLVGQQLQIEVDPDTNEMRSMPQDWFVLKTHVIET